MARRPHQRGAATTELVGIVAIVAALLGALGPLLAGSVSLDERPPPVVARLAAPVAPIEGAPYVNLEQRLPPWPRYAESSGDLAMLGAEVWAQAIYGYRIARGNTVAFTDGFRSCFVADVRALSEDPLGEIHVLLATRGTRDRPGPRGGERSPERDASRLLQIVVEEAGDLGPAARRLYADGAAQVRRGDIAGAGRALNREAGCLAWDVGVTRALGRGRKYLEDRARDRVERSLGADRSR